jgi:hypothetical protein
MQVLLGESHSHNPLNVRQSTSIAFKPSSAITPPLHKIIRSTSTPQIKSTTESSMSIYDDNLPISSDRSQNSMTSHSPFSNIETNQGEQEMIDELGANDADIHRFYNENAAFLDHNVGDGYESDGEISVLSTQTDQSQQPQCLAIVKRPTSSGSISISSSDLQQRKRQKVKKSMDKNDALDSIFEVQLERDHELAMAKVNMDNKRLEYDEKKLEVEKEQGARKLAIEERRLELESQRMEQQSEMLKLQIEMMKQLLGIIPRQQGVEY